MAPQRTSWFVVLLQNRPGGAEQYKGLLLFLQGSSPVLGSLCPPPGERCLSMPEIGEKERNYYLFEIIQTKVLQNTHKLTQSFLLPLPSLGYRIHDSGSQHHPRGKKGALPKPRGPKKRCQMPRGPQKDVWSPKETPNGCGAWV